MLVDLASRYASAFGILLAGKMIQKAFLSETNNKDYKLDYYPFVEVDFEYVKFGIENSNLEPLVFSSILNGSAGKIFAPPLMMEFSQEKSFVETRVNDSDSVIVERWGTKPYKINIKGILIDLENRTYPSEKIRELNKNWKQNKPIKVVGQQFEELDIHSIYFRSISFKRIEGFQDTLQFSINAQSINEVNFIINT